MCASAHLEIYTHMRTSVYLFMTHVYPICLLYFLFYLFIIVYGVKSLITDKFFEGLQVPQNLQEQTLSMISRLKYSC